MTIRHGLKIMKLLCALFGFLVSELIFGQGTVVNLAEYLTHGEDLNPALADYELTTVDNLSLVQCSTRCTIEGCESFFYRRPTLTCSLYSVYMSAGTSDSSGNGGVYFRPGATDMAPVCPGSETSTTCLTNLALNKAVTMSSSKPDGPANLLVDGDLNQQWFHCASTLENSSPWMLIDLGQVYPVHGVKLYNRLDCCTSRLREVILSMGDNSGTLANVFYHPGSAQEILQATFHPVVSTRFIKIRLNATEYLTICEAQVLAYMG